MMIPILDGPFAGRVHQQDDYRDLPTWTNDVIAERWVNAPSGACVFRPTYEVRKLRDLCYPIRVYLDVMVCGDGEVEVDQLLSFPSIGQYFDFDLPQHNFLTEFDRWFMCKRYEYGSSWPMPYL